MQRIPSRITRTERRIQKGEVRVDESLRQKIESIQKTEFANITSVEEYKLKYDRLPSEVKPFFSKPEDVRRKVEVERQQISNINVLKAKEKVTKYIKARKELKERWYSWSSEKRKSKKDWYDEKRWKYHAKIDFWEQAQEKLRQGYSYDSVFKWVRAKVKQDTAPKPTKIEGSHIQIGKKVYQVTYDKGRVRYIKPVGVYLEDPRKPIQRWDPKQIDVKALTKPKEIITYKPKVPKKTLDPGEQSAKEFYERAEARQQKYQERLARIQETREEKETKAEDKREFKQKIKGLKWTPKEYLSVITGKKTPGGLIKEQYMEEVGIQSEFPELYKEWKEETKGLKKPREFFRDPYKFVKGALEREKEIMALSYSGLPGGKSPKQLAREITTLSATIAGATVIGPLVAVPALTGLAPAIIAGEIGALTGETIFEKPLKKEQVELQIKQAEARSKAYQEYKIELGITDIEKQVKAFDIKYGGKELSKKEYEIAMKELGLLETKQEEVYAKEFDEKRFKELYGKAKEPWYLDLETEILGRPAITSTAFRLAGMGIYGLGRAGLYKLGKPKVETLGLIKDKQFIKYELGEKYIDKLQSGAVAKIRTYREVDINKLILGKPTKALKIKTFKQDFLLSAKNIESWRVMSEKGVTASFAKLEGKLTNIATEKVTDIESLSVSLSKEIQGVTKGVSISLGKVPTVPGKFSLAYEKTLSKATGRASKEFREILSFGRGKAQVFKITPGEEFVGFRTATKLPPSIKGIDKVIDTKSIWVGYQKIRPDIIADITGINLQIGKGGLITAQELVAGGITPTITRGVSVVSKPAFALASINQEIKQTLKLIRTKPITLPKLSPGITGMATASQITDSINKQIKAQLSQQVVSQKESQRQLNRMLSGLDITQKGKQKQQRALSTSQIIGQTNKLENKMMSRLRSTLRTQLKTKLKVRTALATPTPQVTKIVPDIKLPIIPPPFILFPGVKPRKKKKKKKKKAPYIKAYFPGFTEKMLGIKSITVSQKQAEKLIKQTLTGLEIRPHIIIKKRRRKKK